MRALRLEVTAEVVDASEAGITLGTLVGLDLLTPTGHAITFPFRLSMMASGLTAARHAAVLAPHLTATRHAAVVAPQMTATRHAVTFTTQLATTRHAVMFTTQLTPTGHAVTLTTHLTAKGAGNPVQPCVHHPVVVAGQAVRAPFSHVGVTPRAQPVQSRVSHRVHVATGVWQSVQPAAPHGVNVATDAGGGVQVANVCGAVLAAAVHLALGDQGGVPGGQHDALVKVLRAGVHQPRLALSRRRSGLHLSNNHDCICTLFY